MTTMLMILGHPSGSGLTLTAPDIQNLPSGSVELLTCAPCPVQNAGTVVVESTEGQLSMVSYQDRYGKIGAAAGAELQPFLPTGGAAYQFSSAEASRLWYASVQAQLGLHVAYFFDDTETPLYAAA